MQVKRTQTKAMRTMPGSKTDYTRRTIFRRGIAVAAGAVAIGTMAKIQPAQAAKVKQAVAMYQPKPHASQKCVQCVHFAAGKTPTADGTCKLVEGSISPNGWCVLFAPKS